MADDCASVVTRELDPGERLLWAGRPKTWVHLSAGEAIELLPFVIIFVVAGTFFVSPLNGGRLSVPFFLGMAFLILGAYWILGAFAVDILWRARGCYALTDRRLIMMLHWRARVVKSFDLRTMTNLSAIEREDGSGTIEFGPGQSPQARANPRLWAGRPAFRSVERVRQVYELIRQAQRNALGAPS